MRLLITVVLPLGVFVTARSLTERLRGYALARQLLDLPNVRSSHAVAVPRGGGVSIVLTTLMALPVLGALGALTWTMVCGLLGGGALVALVGFADDHKDIPPRWRLLGHFSAASWLLLWFGGPPALSIFGFALEGDWFGRVLAVLYVVWLLNLTNFMDGIDGLAGVEAITVSVSAALLFVVAVPGSIQWLAPVVVASATLGFLGWNWPPAKIFMGDAGSGFLGFTLAALSLHAASVTPALFWGWVILLGAFVVDATVTLLRRMARGERVYEAHCSHAYQHAAQQLGGHLPVTLAVGAINLCWLLPVALLVVVGVVEGSVGVLIAYTPLVILALWLKAGKPDSM